MHHKLLEEEVPLTHPTLPWGWGWGTVDAATALTGLLALERPMLLRTTSRTAADRARGLSRASPWAAGVNRCCTVLTTGRKTADFLPTLGS